MCLRNNKVLKFFFIFVFCQSSYLNASDDQNTKVIDYLNKLRFFSASFIQNENTSVSDGEIFIGDKRIRVEYNNPEKILIILDKDKAMYYNYELDEDEFFNPKDTSAWFFFDIFFNPEFFYDSEIIEGNNYLELIKKGLYEQEDYQIKIIFENNPFVIRKIILDQNDRSLKLSVFDHKYNNSYNKDFFKLINPIFFD